MSTSPVPPVAMPGIAGRVDEDLLVRRRDERAVPLQDDVDVMRDGEVARDLEAARLHLVDRHADAAAPSRPGCGVMITSRPSRPASRSGSSRERVQRRRRRSRAASSRDRRAPGRTRACPAPWPRPGPDRDDVARHLEDALDAVRSRVPSAVSSSASVMYSGPIAATIGWHAAGVATVTRPAPDRSAPTAARCAAPVLPREPATTSTRP